jgi:hypothetical protein
MGQAALTAPALLAPAEEAAVDVAHPTFTWQAVTGATFYLITITQDGAGGGRQVITGTSAGTSYVPTRGLFAGAGYTWQVSAADDAGATALSAVRHFVVADQLRPSAPLLTDLDGRALGNGQRVRLNYAPLHWRPRAALAPGQFYELQVSYADGVEFVSWRANDYEIRPDVPYFLQLTDTDATSHSRLGVSCGEAYRWRVRVLVTVEPQATAVNFSDAARATAMAINHRAAVRAGSAWSETWTFNVPPRPSAAPSLLAPADGATIRGGRLSWSNPDPAASLFYEYEVVSAAGLEEDQYRPADFPETQSRPLDLNATPETSFFGIGLTSGETYYWRVRASYAAGLCWSPWSSRRSFIWQGPTMGGEPRLDPPPLPCSTPGCPTDTPGPSPTATRPPTRTPRASATSTATGVPLIILVSPVPPATAVPSATASDLPKPTETPVPSDTPKPTDVPVPSDTPKPTSSPIPEKPKETETPKVG